MTTQFIQIGNTIINLQLVTSVCHASTEDDINTYTWIYFNHDDSVILEGEKAKRFWRFLRDSSMNITP